MMVALPPPPPTYAYVTTWNTADTSACSNTFPGYYCQLKDDLYEAPEVLFDLVSCSELDWFSCEWLPEEMLWWPHNEREASCALLVRKGRMRYPVGET